MSKRLPFSLTRILEKQLQKIEPKEKKLYGELFIETLIEKALVEKDIQAYKMIMGYIDGLPTARVEVDTGKNINNILKEIHGFNNEGKQKTISGQVLENESFVQDNKQERSTSDFST